MSLSLLLSMLYLTACFAKPGPPTNFRQAVSGTASSGLFVPDGALGRASFLPRASQRASERSAPTGTIAGRAKRTGSIPIRECTFIYTEEGDFYLDYEADPNQVCGVMFLAPPSMRIELRLNLDVSCSSGGIVSVVDGWDYQNQLIPLATDHPKPESERHITLCGHEQHVLQMSANAAQLSYLLPNGGRFAISVRFVRNKNPCSVLLEDTGVMTLRNFGMRRNCTVTTIFPSIVRLLQMQVGVAESHPNLEPETGTIHKCEKRGLEDYVQIAGLGSVTELAGPLTVFGSVCGLDTSAGRPMGVLCGAANVRLVSSGRYDNAVTVYVKRMDSEEELMSADYFCDGDL